MAGEKVRLSLDVSPELNQLLDTLADKIGGSKSEVLRKAIILMEAAVDANEHGRKLLIVDSTAHLEVPYVTEIVGIVGPRRVSEPARGMTQNEFGSTPSSTGGAIEEPSFTRSE